MLHSASLVRCSYKLMRNQSVWRCSYLKLVWIRIFFLGPTSYNLPFYSWPTWYSQKLSIHKFRATIHCVHTSCLRQRIGWMMHIRHPGTWLSLFHRKKAASRHLRGNLRNFWYVGMSTLHIQSTTSYPIALSLRQNATMNYGNFFSLALDEAEFTPCP